MRSKNGFPIIAGLAFVSAIVFLGLNAVYSHCDTLDGPVIKDAKTALEKADVTPVLKWVKKEHEGEIKAAFNSALSERSKGGQAKENADRKFFETLIRIHREGEGASFTGLKPEGSVEPVLAEADKALETGSADKLIKEIAEEVTNGIRHRFHIAMEKRKHMDDSVEAGREYVKAYVEYVHYIEGLHEAISAQSAHHHEETEKAEHKAD